MAQHRFDALILTALLDELEPVLEFGEGGKSQWEMDCDSTGFPYHVRELPSVLDGGPLHIAAVSFNEMGGSATAARAAALIQELNPSCLAMCGICAGNKKDVALGDVIVADRTYQYDYGKLVAWRDEDGKRQEHLYLDLKTYNLEHTWRVNAAYFARELGWTTELVKTRPPSQQFQQDWLLWTLFEYEQKGQPLPHDFGGPERKIHCPDFAALWDRLRQPEHGLLLATGGSPQLTEKGKVLALRLKFKYPDGLKPDRNFQIHVGPIATGSLVQKDPELFDRLEKHVRRTLGAEMESVAISLVAEQLQRRSIIVKAASDHGDGEKNDSFRKFAARASAEVLIRFLQQHLKPSSRQLDDDQGGVLHTLKYFGRAGPTDPGNKAERSSSPPRRPSLPPKPLRTAERPEPSHAPEISVPSQARIPSPHSRDQVFVSYSHKDSKWLERLEKHLKPRIRNSKLDVWSDKRIDAGADWRKEIDEALARAKVAVLLVSPDFLASDFIARNELPPLLEAAKQEGVTILWVPVSSAAYKEVKLDIYQAVLDPSKPLKKRHHAYVDDAMEEICNAISQAFFA